MIKIVNKEGTWAYFKYGSAQGEPQIFEVGGILHIKKGYSPNLQLCYAQALVTMQN